jgi:two-component system chemotaxis sensor kinase CheA
MSLILTPLEKMVAELSLSIDKEIDFSIHGGDLLLDKLVLEKLNDPLIHLVRNAVDHGLESPDVRRRKGKPAAGTLRIDCYPEGGNIIVRLTDDGRGVDYGKIREKAMAQNPLQADEIRDMDPAALNSFIFSPGFSTTDKVRDLSGRGVGLDIVRHNIEQVKGRITLESLPDAGTTFTLSLPLSLATVEGFFVSAGGEKFLIPSNFIHEIAIVDERQRMTILDRWAIKLHGKVVPVYPLAAVLDRSWEEEPGDRIFVVVVESLGEMVGIRVDAVVQFASLIYKPLPRGLAGLGLLQGIVFDDNYNIVSILYIPEVMRRFKSIRDIETRRKFSADRREYKRVLVVDDSYSAREIQRSILELENYTVETAADGIEGLDRLKEQRFHLIITDIKMPRMDGLTFVENLRRDDGNRGTPVIVVSSVDDPDTRRRFMEKGANGFIVKSEFDRGNLIQEVRRLIG